MDKKEFFDLLWRFEEIMMQADYLLNQIGKCGKSCDIEDDGLCPECCTVFEKVHAEDKRLAGNKDFRVILRKLKQACDDDKTGEFKRIMSKSRESKVVH